MQSENYKWFNITYDYIVFKYFCMYFANMPTRNTWNIVNIFLQWIYGNDSCCFLQ